MPSASIVIPAYNEEQAIGQVLDALRGLPGDNEIIVVDDGSVDRTRAIAAERGCRVVRHPVTFGYGRSVKDGIQAASSDTIVLSDADGTYPIAMIPTLVAKLGEGFDMVVGARQGREYRGSFLKMPARAIFKLLAEFITGTHIPDVNSGLRVFRRTDVLPYIPDLCNGFSFTTTITLLYLLTGKFIAYVPIAYNKRIGRSKVRMVRDSLRTLQYLIEAIVRFNPIKLFFLLSLVALVAGAVLTVWGGLSAMVTGIFSALFIFSMGLLAHAAHFRK
jgi:glycosyltransferase involved in cell wall biosynthesis